MVEIRNIQKTGDMHYLYLPTAWCRKHKISNKSKASIEQKSDGSLVISPKLIDRKQKHLDFTLNDSEPEVLYKLVVASYINPLRSFEIKLSKEINFSSILEQKQLLSLESVEIDKKSIICNGAVMIQHPESLLKTMVKKIKNLLIIMKNNYNKELIERYEDEIDRSKILIDKSVISSLTFGNSGELKNIDLYYISLISKELEQMVDRLLILGPQDNTFLDTLSPPIELLDHILHNIFSLDQKQATDFAKSVAMLGEITIKDLKTHEMKQVKQNFVRISEVIMDWMVTQKIED